MRSALLALFGILLAATLPELLSSGDAKKGPMRSIRLLTALMTMILIAEPLLTLLKSDATPSFSFGEEMKTLEEQYQQQFEDALAARGEQDLIDGIHGLLSTGYGIDAKDAQVDLYFSESGTLDTVCITLKGKALLVDPRDIMHDFEDKLKCNVEVR